MLSIQTIAKHILTIENNCQQIMSITQMIASHLCPEDIPNHLWSGLTQSLCNLEAIANLTYDVIAAQRLNDHYNTQQPPHQN